MANEGTMKNCHPPVQFLRRRTKPSRRWAGFSRGESGAAEDTDEVPEDGVELDGSRGPVEPEERAEPAKPAQSAEDNRSSQPCASGWDGPREAQALRDEAARAKYRGCLAASMAIRGTMTRLYPPC